jgi:putative sterol carrier protein
MLIAETINELRQRFKPEAAEDLTATYLFDIVGNDGGRWLAKIDKGSCSFLTLENDDPFAPVDCTITVAAEDLQMILDGRLSAMTAAMSGVLTVDGEIGLAMQLVPIFFHGQAPFI